MLQIMVPLVIPIVLIFSVNSQKNIMRLKARELWNDLADQLAVSCKKSIPSPYFSLNYDEIPACIAMRFTSL